MGVLSTVFSQIPSVFRNVSQILREHHQGASSTCQLPGPLSAGMCQPLEEESSISIFKLAAQVILRHTQRISNALPIPLPHWTVDLPPLQSIHGIFREWGKWGVWYPYVCGSSWEFSDTVKYRVISELSRKHCSESFQQCLRRIIIE